MNALNQYIDLFEAHSGLVEENAAAVLNAPRQAALESLIGVSLPKKGSENYEQTDLNEMLSPDFGLNIARVPMDVNPQESFHCEVPNLSTSLFFIVNDRFGRTDNSYNGLPDGVEVCSLNAYALENPDFVVEYYGKAASLGNPVVALNTLFCQDGLLIRVRKGTHVEKTIQLVNILHSQLPLMAVRRILIVLEEDSSLKILSCDHTQVSDVRLMSLQTIELFVGRNARLDFYDMEESTRSTGRISSLYLRQEENSHVVLNGITLFNGETRNEFDCRFLGPGSTLKLLGLGIEDDNRRLDNFSYISHDVPDCKTDELFKYVVEEQAVGAFTGIIYVAPGATKTEAFQSNRNLVTSAEARMYSKPQLEIYNDDVKCSHGTAIGQLDEKQLFYMRTRGIDEDTARLLLKQAFMNDVIDAVKLPVLADRLRHLVHMRFSGVKNVCGNCNLGN